MLSGSGTDWEAGVGGWSPGTATSSTQAFIPIPYVWEGGMGSIRKGGALKRLPEWVEPQGLSQWFLVPLPCPYRHRCHSHQSQYFEYSQ